MQGGLGGEKLECEMKTAAAKDEKLLGERMRETDTMRKRRSPIGKETKKGKNENRRIGSGKDKMGKERNQNGRTIYIYRENPNKNI